MDCCWLYMSCLPRSVRMERCSGSGRPTCPPSQFPSGCTLTLPFQGAGCVGFVVGFFNVLISTPSLPPPCRLAITLELKPLTYLGWTFVPFTAAGQRGPLTPLPRFHSVFEMSVTDAKNSGSCQAVPGRKGSGCFLEVLTVVSQRLQNEATGSGCYGTAGKYSSG